MDFLISYLSISMSGTCSSRRPNFWLRVKQKISYAKLFSQIVSITFTKISDKFNHAVSFSHSDAVLFQIRFGNETHAVNRQGNKQKLGSKKRKAWWLTTVNRLFRKLQIVLRFYVNILGSSPLSKDHPATEFLAISTSASKYPKLQPSATDRWQRKKVTVFLIIWCDITRILTWMARI